MSFGSRLRERRKALGLTQEAVGKQLNITSSAVGNYENGISFPNADILYQVFSVLKCDANYLFQDEMGESIEFERQSALINLFIQLNEEGQNKLIDNADDLVSSGKYIKSHPDAMGTET